MLDLVNFNWNGSSKKTQTLSVTDFVEQNDILIRKIYTNTIHKISINLIANKKSNSIFYIDNKPILLWMSLLYEKNFYKSKNISKCIKLIALEKLLIEKKPNNIELICSDRSLILSINDLCKKYEIISYIEYKKNNTEYKDINIKSILPKLIKSFFYFFLYILKSLRLKKISHPQWNSNKNSVFLFSYFSHINTDLSSENIIKSNQWEGLVDLIKSKKININWLHLYALENNKKKLENFIYGISNDNKNPISQDKHIFLESYTSLNIIIKTLIVYLKIYMKNFFIKTNKTNFITDQSKINFFELMAEDWNDSFSGITLIQNIFWLFLFDAAMKDFPISKIGFFPQENQAWERALISSWKKNNNAKLIGFAHSYIRFWDTKYFENQEVYQNKDLKIPMADLLAVNSNQAYNMFLDEKVPDDRICKVEALRYIDTYLNGIKSFKSKNNILKKILIIGDYQVSENIKLLEDLKKIDIANKKFQIYFKPHPGFDIDISKFKSLRINKIYEKLEKILNDYDVVIAVDATAACIDAYLMNKYIIVYRKKYELNYSPLRGFKNINFASNSEELYKCIKNQTQKISNKSDSLFIFDKNLLLWNKLINENIK